MKTFLDIGCGRSKDEEAYGVDIYPYEGVDKVLDINKVPWDLPDNHFQKVRGIHVIEHVADVVSFMKEIHRICAPGAEIYFETPHFSSINSWNNPTHVWHLSSTWYEEFVADGYLVPQAGRFRCLQSEVTFGKSLRASIGKMLYNIRGPKKWEKYSAFSFPGMDIKTTLCVEKN